MVAPNERIDLVCEVGYSIHVWPVAHCSEEQNVWLQAPNRLGQFVPLGSRNVLDAVSDDVSWQAAAAKFRGLLLCCDDRIGKAGKNGSLVLRQTFALT